jgi:cell volume regulation protein A
VARPVAVLLCLLPFRFDWRETLYIGWVGLRGAVPIVLATFPVLAGVEGGAHIFNIVFFVVVVAAMVQGSTMRWLTHKLRLESARPPAPSASLEITSTDVHEDETAVFFVREDLPIAGKQLSELSFPEGAAVMLIVRGVRLIPPKGNTVLTPGDHVYVIHRRELRDELRRLFDADRS